MLSNTDDALTNALFAAVALFSYLAHLPLLPFVRAHQLRLGRMPFPLLDRPLMFTFCQLWLALPQAIRPRAVPTVQTLYSPEESDACLSGRELSDC